MSNQNDIDNKRTILIVACFVLIVICILTLPRLCSAHQNSRGSGSTKLAPGLTVPITNDTIIGGNSDGGDGAFGDSTTKRTNVHSNTAGQNCSNLDDSLAYTEIDNLRDSNSSDPEDDEDYEVECLSNEDSSGDRYLSDESACGLDDDKLHNSDRDNSANNSDNKIPQTTRNDSSDYPTSTYRNDVNGEVKIVVLTILSLLLICYIVARVKLKHGTLVITANVVDKILIILSPILFFIVWCIGFGHDMSALQILLLCLSGILLVVSIIFSIIANLGSLWNIILSVMAKLFIFVFTNILLLLVIVILVFSIMRTIMSHDDHESTYVVKYDHFLDQWVGYRVD